MHILMVPSSAATLPLADGSLFATGFWAQEFVPPYQIFAAAGFTIDIATVSGAPAVLDPNCLAPELHEYDLAAIRQLQADLAALPGWQAPLSLEAALAQVAGYDAVFFPGGHGPQADLAAAPLCGELLGQMLARGGRIGAVCHGQAALLALPEAAWPFAGYRMTCFSAADEIMAGLGGRLQWVLAERLAQRGGILTHAPANQPHVVVDRQLFTGQNPASVHALAHAMVAALQAGQA